MAKIDRTYKVAIDMSGPNPMPILKDQSGNPIPPTQRLQFDKGTKKKKVDHFRIHFALENPGQTDLRFIQDMNDVLWVHDDITVCPSSPCSMPAVFWVDEVDRHGRWVDVINMDLVPELFRFTLNLADKNISNPTPADYVPLDPIGENQDRGIAGSEDRSFLIEAIGVGLVSGVVAFTAARMFLPTW